MELIHNHGNYPLPASHPVVYDSHWINNPNGFLLIRPQVENSVPFVGGELMRINWILFHRCQEAPQVSNQLPALQTLIILHGRGDHQENDWKLLENMQFCLLLWETGSAKSGQPFCGNGNVRVYNRHLERKKKKGKRRKGTCLRVIFKSLAYMFFLHSKSKKMDLRGI